MMASPPINLTVLEESQVAPPPATVADISLPLAFFDIIYLLRSPIHVLFFYQLPLTSTQFMETIVPNLKHSLSTTLQHFFPYAGKLIVFPNPARKPEIRYVQGDSVNVTFAESNLDFDDLTGYQPRNCDKFYHLIPPLGDLDKTSDYAKTPVFSLQVTLFPNTGISIGMNIHHSLVDATTHFSFLKAWTSIARCGKDELFLANGTLPIYERLVNPKLDAIFLNNTTVETFFRKDYQIPHLSGTSDKVRATFVLRRTLIDELKKHVITQLPTLPYVSSFTVACAYTWCCILKSRDGEREAFLIPLDCRTRMDPPLPDGYFGNCIWGSVAIENTTILAGKEGFLTAAKLIGESLHNTLTDKDGIVNHKKLTGDLFSGGKPVTLISISGTPKLKLYNVDFGWGRPKKFEKISLDYGNSISIDAGKESNQDLEIGVCLTTTQMQVFSHMFNLGLQLCI